MSAVHGDTASIRPKAVQMRHVMRGVLAGAAGTTALNTATFLDMSLRGRPASTTPQQMVEQAEQLSGQSLGADENTASNRRSGVGSLLGVATGVAAGVVYGLARARWPRAPRTVLALGAGAAANLGSVAPMTLLGVSDPRSWSATSWVSDVVPHLAYGFTTALAYDLSDPATRT